jgi:hypothetical protein
VTRGPRHAGEGHARAKTAEQGQNEAGGVTLGFGVGVSVIEVMSFRLAGGTDEAAFLEADRRVQTEFAYRQRGLLRRTTARNDDGEWMVIDLWRSDADADASDARWDGDAAAAAFMALVDRATVQIRRYHELD